MNKKKGNLNRAILLRDQFVEDGRTIGRLQLAIRYLATRLAYAGAYPSFPPNNEKDSKKIAMITAIWIDEAERVSKEMYGKQSASYKAGV